LTGAKKKKTKKRGKNESSKVSEDREREEEKKVKINYNPDSPDVQLPVGNAEQPEAQVKKNLNQKESDLKIDTAGSFTEAHGKDLKISSLERKVKLLTEKLTKAEQVKEDSEQNAEKERKLKQEMSRNLEKEKRQKSDLSENLEAANEEISSLKDLYRKEEKKKQDCLVRLNDMEREKKGLVEMIKNKESSEQKWTKNVSKTAPKSSGKTKSLICGLLTDCSFKKDNADCRDHYFIISKCNFESVIYFFQLKILISTITEKNRIVI
jgi:hypothetical protein